MPPGTLESFFVEHRLLTEVSHGGGALRLVRSEREVGCSVELTRGGQPLHVWEPLPRGARTPAALPAAASSRLALLRDPTAMAAPLLEPLRELTLSLEQAVRQAGGSAVDVLVHDAWQKVCCGPAEAWAEEERRHTLIELRVSVDQEKRPAHLWRPFWFQDPGALAAARGQLETACVELVQSLQAWPAPAPCPEGELPVVFPPGAASGSFFHEVCGHPLEGDVVARRGSYLAVRLGERVAEEFVTVTDDPTERSSALHYGFDDEGQAARRVALLERGVVGQPLLSRDTAGILGRESNGHGRRVSFRHYPLPRMTHTGVAAGPHGTLEQLLAPVGRGLLVQHLVPRHMNLLSGDFSFFIIEAREIRDGRPGPLIGPGVLSGNGLQALSDLEAVGGERRSLFATRGCRKLDHGPLAVSFTQPSLRFRRLRVTPARLP
jgi:TldD protein